MSSPEELVAFYMNEGIRLVRLSGDTRKPVDTGWQDPEKVNHYREVFEEHVRAGGGIGWQLGEVSGWLAVVDNDWELARKLAPKFLPESLRAAKGSEDPSHYVYYSEGLGFEAFNGLDGSRIVDVKASANGRGHQAAVAPTVHPEKGPYQFVGGYNPAAIETVEAAELRHRIRLLVCAALIAANLPASKEEGVGGRHDLALALIGYMLRNGVPARDVEKVLVEVWHVRGAPREAIEDLRRSIPDTVDRLAKGDPVRGGHKLEEAIPGMPRRIAEILDWSRRDMEEKRKSYMRTDLGNAERLIDRHGRDLLYCFRWKTWLVYDGTRWRADDGGEIRRRAKDTVRGIYAEAEHAPDDDERKAIARHALASENEARINAMIALARSEAEVDHSDLDADPYLLNVENGTLDLRTGELRGHDRADLITRVSDTRFDPDAEAPIWESHLQRVLPDETLQAFVRRALGYSLTGDVSEEALFVPYGTGQNGKTVTYNAMLAVLGDYGMSAAPDLLLSKKGAHPTEQADLLGARLVVCMEAEEGRRLAESLVKRLTGRDKIKARRMGENFWEFWPSHKFHMSVNHRPEIRGQDEGIWRRVKIIPFTTVIPEDQKDRRLDEKLAAEKPGILAWAVRGSVEWYEHGLDEPAAVSKATSEYRAEMDVIGGFLEECCEIGDDYKELASEVYGAYQRWCSANGEREITRRQLTKKLADRGYQSKRSGPNGAREYHGLHLLTFWKFDICRETDRTDAEFPKRDPENNSHGKIGKNASVASVRQSTEGGGGGTNTPSENGSTHQQPRRWLNEEQTRQVQKLISQGFSPEMARAEVLGDVERF